MIDVGEKEIIKDFIIRVEGETATLYKIHCNKRKMVRLLMEMTIKYGENYVGQENEVRMDATFLRGTRILTDRGLVTNYSKKSVGVISPINSITQKPYPIKLANVEYECFSYPTLARAVLMFLQSQSKIEEFYGVIRDFATNIDNCTLEYIYSIMSLVRKEEIFSCPKEDLFDLLIPSFVGTTFERRKKINNFIQQNSVYGDNIIDTIPILKEKEKGIMRERGSFCKIVRRVDKKLAIDD